MTLPDEDRELVRRGLESVRGVKSKRGKAKALGVSEGLVRKWIAGEVGVPLAEKTRTALRNTLDKKARPDQHTAPTNGSGDLLDRWGYQRAKAIADLAELLREDTTILKMRAEAAVNASRAALLEAEKAPARGLPLSSAEIDRALRAIEVLGAWGVSVSEGRSSEAPKRSGEPRSDEES